MLYKFFKTKNGPNLKHLANYKQPLNTLSFLIKNFALFMSLVFISIIILRPVSGYEQATGVSSNLDVLIIADISPSMNVVDFDNSNRKTRIEGMKDFLIEFTKAEPQNRYSLISFAHTANLELPLTYDLTSVKVAIETLTAVDDYSANGTSLSSGFKQAEKRLLNVKDFSGELRQKVIMFLSDGENLGDKDYQQAVSLLASKGIKTYSFGFGTEQGGKVPQYELNGTTYYYRYKGSDAISKLDENTLKTIAQTGNGFYTKVNQNTDPKNILTNLTEFQLKSITNTDTTIYKDLYYFFTIPLIISLVIFEIDVLGFTRMLRKKKNNLLDNNK